MLKLAAREVNQVDRVNSGPAPNVSELRSSTPGRN
jgi:hypothetical protein